MNTSDAIICDAEVFSDYLQSDQRSPLFVRGDCLEILRTFPAGSIDFAMTSPPYWGQRAYSDGGIGLEATYPEYVRGLLAITAEVKRALKPTGSFWLNIGDAYDKKCQVGIPWRVALAMTDQQGWILRNDIVWNKVKGGMDNAKDKFRNVHEPIFHFVKSTKYFTTPMRSASLPVSQRLSTAQWSPRPGFPASATADKSSFPRC